MGQDSPELDGVHLGDAAQPVGSLGPFDAFEELADQLVIQGMSALAGEDLPAEGPAGEIEIADQVENLVADAFVGVAELIATTPSGPMTTTSS